MTSSPHRVASQVLAPVSAVCDIPADTDSARKSGTDVLSSPSICRVYISGCTEIVNFSNQCQITEEELVENNGPCDQSDSSVSRDSKREQLATPGTQLT